MSVTKILRVRFHDTYGRYKNKIKLKKKNVEYIKIVMVIILAWWDLSIIS